MRNWNCCCAGLQRVVTMVPFTARNLQQFRHAVISLDFASVATSAMTMRNSQPQALTMCKADLPPGLVETNGASLCLHRSR